MRKGIIILLLIGIAFFTCISVNAQVGFEDDSVQIQFNDEIEPTQRPTRTPTPTKIQARDHIIYGEQKAKFEKDGIVVIDTPPAQETKSYLETSLSSVKISFDSLRPNMMQEKSVSMGVSSNSGSYSYQVVGMQSGFFVSPGGFGIDNTLCDIVKTPCTTTYARKWESNEASGFGYRLRGQDSPLDFINDTYYRVFPVTVDKKGKSTSDLPVVLFQNNSIEGNREGAITFKIVPPPTFTEGTYTTELKIITYPSL